MATVSNSPFQKTSSPQDTLVRAFLPADVLKGSGLSGKDASFVLYEKFQMLGTAFAPPFTDEAEQTFQAFIMKAKGDGTYTSEMVEDGRHTFAEFSITRSGTVSRKREGFVYSGKIINTSALAYFKTEEGEIFVIALKDGNEKYKASAGSLEGTDTIDDGKGLSLAEALAKGALRELAEETLGLSKEDAKKMSLSDLKTYIQGAVKCSRVACTALIQKTRSGSYERLPKPEFNSNTMLSPSVVVDLGEAGLEDVKAAIRESSPKDIPALIAEETATNPNTFRNAEQMKYYFAHPEMGFFV